MADEIENDQLTTIGDVLGRIPSGVFIVTARNESGQETGMLASWIQQAAFTPPMITVAINKSRYLLEWLDQVPRLAISIVGENQKDFLKHFGRGFEPGEPAFEGLQTVRTAGDLPALAEALGYLEGQIQGRLDAGDHVIVLLSVTGAGASETLATMPPMTHIRKNGFGY